MTNQPTRQRHNRKNTEARAQALANELGEAVYVCTDDRASTSYTFYVAIRSSAYHQYGNDQHNTIVATVRPEAN